MFIRALYLIAAMVFALGLGLLIFSMLGSDKVTLCGVILSPRHAKGIGIIAMLFGTILIFAVFGSS